MCLPFFLVNTQDLRNLRISNSFVIFQLFLFFVYPAELMCIHNFVLNVSFAHEKLCKIDHIIFFLSITQWDFEDKNVAIDFQINDERNVISPYHIFRTVSHNLFYSKLRWYWCDFSLFYYNRISSDLSVNLLTDEIFTSWIIVIIDFSNSRIRQWF